MRLIDAHDLWSDIMMLPHNGDMISSEEVEQAIKEAPTVDAVEVVHGRCVYVRDDEFIDHWECSVCGKYIPWEYHRDFNYCPYCGAKMDGEL